MAILEAENVTYRYESKYNTAEVLHGVSCSFERGSFYAIVGKSGSGKSTLLSLLAGLMLPCGGSVRFEGKATSEMNLNTYRREKAAVIYQSFRLFPLLTVSENITFPMELRGIRGKRAREAAAALAERVNLPTEVLNRFPDMLSGGEQQRVAIARAMGMGSGLILADEPTGNLDSENGSKIVSLLLRLAHEENYCVVVVTHDMEIAALADCVYRMRDGNLTKESV